MYVVIVKLPFHNSITHTDERVMSNVGKYGWHKYIYGVRGLAWISDKGI